MGFFSALLFTFLTSSLFAAENFGGIRFHSSMAPDHVDYLKEDLKFLYRLPVQRANTELIQITGLPSITGSHLHYWLVDRVRHIVGENFVVNSQTMESTPYINFPPTPLPPRKMPAFALPGKTPYVRAPIVTIMSNMGAVYYDLSKTTKILRSFNLDGLIVPFTSTRAGVVKVGQGLFQRTSQLNPNPVSQVNMISRLMILFHEARHSDGSGVRAGFFHSYCPPKHTYALNSACEDTANGPYSLSAIVLKQLIKNCSTCTTAEKSKLEAKVADAYGRVLKVGDEMKVNQLTNQIKLLRNILAAYKLKKNKSHAFEITNLENQITTLEASLAVAHVSQTPPSVNARPEGVWTPRHLQETRSMMERSLRK